MCFSPPFSGFLSTFVSARWLLVVFMFTNKHKKTTPWYWTLGVCVCERVSEVLRKSCRWNLLLHSSNHARNVSSQSFRVFFAHSFLCVCFDTLTHAIAHIFFIKKLVFDAIYLFACISLLLLSSFTIMFRSFSFLSLSLIFYPFYMVWSMDSPNTRIYTNTSTAHIHAACRRFSNYFDCIKRL